MPWTYQCNGVWFWKMDAPEQLSIVEPHFYTHKPVPLPLPCQGISSNGWNGASLLPFSGKPFRKCQKESCCSPSDWSCHAMPAGCVTELAVEGECAHSRIESDSLCCGGGRRDFISSRKILHVRIIQFMFCWANSPKKWRFNDSMRAKKQSECVAGYMKTLYSEIYANYPLCYTHCVHCELGILWVLIIFLDQSSCLVTKGQEIM